VFFVRTLVFGVVDERVVETGFKPVSTHVINYGSPKSVTKTHHEPNTLVKFIYILLSSGLKM